VQVLEKVLVLLKPSTGKSAGAGENQVLEKVLGMWMLSAVPSRVLLHKGTKRYCYLVFTNTPA
jgi:hypothetical protein